MKAREAARKAAAQTDEEKGLLSSESAPKDSK